jgi:hypothetical protein
MSRTAMMKVGAGQYMSSRVAITMLPMIPPRRAAIIDTATPVARKLVGNTSVMRQSRAALPQLMALLKIADTTRLLVELCTKNRPMAHIPDVKVLKTGASVLKGVAHSFA